MRAAVGSLLCCPAGTFAEPPPASWPKSLPDTAVSAGPIVLGCRIQVDSEGTASLTGLL